MLNIFMIPFWLSKQINGMQLLEYKVRNQFKLMPRLVSKIVKIYLREILVIRVAASHLLQINKEGLCLNGKL